MRSVVVALLVFLTLAGVLPLLAFSLFWVDLDGHGRPDLTVPFVGIVQSGAAALFAWAVLRRCAMLPLYTVWAITCLGGVATLLARPATEIVRTGILAVAGMVVVVLVGVGFWVVQAKGHTA